MIKVYPKISDRTEDWQNMSLIREQFSIIISEEEDSRNLIITLHNNQIKIMAYIRNLENKIIALQSEIRRR